MEWDELKPKPRKEATIGENLESFSIEELNARIAALRDEIGRTEAELERKRRHAAAADALFGKPA